jgi:NH3-dependent NAD+ synthetase
MKKINHTAFIKKYQSADTTDEKHQLLKNFMLGMSFEELMDWNNFLSDNIDILINKNIATGLTKEDKEFYHQQFARFDNLMEQNQHKAAA